MRVWSGIRQCTRWGLVGVLGVVFSESAFAQNKVSGIGDSIMQGFSANGRNLGDQEQYSFAQGNDSTVQSIFLRWQASRPGLTQEFVSVSGAEMVGGSNNAAAQAQRICAQPVKPDRVLIQLGGNDVCNRSRNRRGDPTAGMYAANTYRNALTAALDTLGECLPPGAEVLVTSMPRVDYLYEAKASRFSCRLIWSFGGICSLVTQESSRSRRRAIGARIDAYNTALREATEAADRRYRNPTGVRFFTDWVGPMSTAPNTSVGTYVLKSEDVSNADCFHPFFRTGQRKVACVAWETLEGNTDRIPNQCLAR